MHSILTDLCTGCELCIAPCPVDCIDLVEDLKPLPSDELRLNEENDLRSRYYAHIQREDKTRSSRQDPLVRAEIDTEFFTQFSAQFNTLPTVTVTEKVVDLAPKLDAKSTIELAKLRSQIKKLEKQLSVREDTPKRLLLETLNQQLNQLQGTTV